MNAVIGFAMKELLTELENMSNRGGLALANISLKEGMATLSCTYSGPDNASRYEWLASQVLQVNASPPNQLEVGPVSEGSFTFKASLPKAACCRLPPWRAFP